MVNKDLPDPDPGITSEVSCIFFFCSVNNKDSFLAAFRDLFFLFFFGERRLSCERPRRGPSDVNQVRSDAEEDSCPFSVAERVKGFIKRMAPL